MIKRVFVVLSFFFVFSSVAHASQWMVERATENVSVSADGTKWQSVQAGDAVKNAYWLRTGPKARVILVKGSERIMYRENTLAAISVSQPTGKRTKVTQRRGSVLLAVQKRRTQHTSVVTPHLAAVVKGTVFEVSVDGEQSDVRVDRGRVEVSDGDQSVAVSAGRMASVGPRMQGVKVGVATETALTPSGAIGLERAEIRSNGNAGGQGHGVANGKGTNNAGGNGNASGHGNGNAGGNGNSSENGNAGGNGNGNGGGNGNGNGNGGRN